MWKKSRVDDALCDIARLIEEQTELEKFQSHRGLSSDAIDLGRVDTYRKIVRIVMTALGRPVPVVM